MIYAYQTFWNQPSSSPQVAGVTQLQWLKCNIAPCEEKGYSQSISALKRALNVKFRY